METDGTTPGSLDMLFTKAERCLRLGRRNVERGLQALVVFTKIPKKTSKSETAVNDNESSL